MYTLSYSLPTQDEVFNRDHTVSHRDNCVTCGEDPKAVPLIMRTMVVMLLCKQEVLVYVHIFLSYLSLASNY
jgi:hypothetical protein